MSKWDIFASSVTTLLFSTFTHFLKEKKNTIEVSNLSLI